MKYKHYSPNARVVLAEGSADVIPKDLMELRLELGDTDETFLTKYDGLPYESQNGRYRLPTIGIVRTHHWVKWGGLNESGWAHVKPLPSAPEQPTAAQNDIEECMDKGVLYSNGEPSAPLAGVLDVHLGISTRSIAHHLFLTLRELDKRNADLIFVEGIDEEHYNSHHAGCDDEGDMAAAIMNRLRKAATVIKS
jgi:L-threonylcarbamoyladenylate synthase